MKIPPFHLAFPVHDLIKAREFYEQIMGCGVGRTSDTWTDFNLYGHQIVAHLVKAYQPARFTNPVDAHDVPVPHFGLVLDMTDWQELANHLVEKGIEFVIKPYIRFQGEVGEQATMFFLDPSGNALEFKAFRDPSQLFTT